MEKKKILLDGFHVSFDSRVLFMREVFRYPKIRQEIMKKIIEEGGLEDWKGCERTTFGNSQFIHMEMTDEDLIVMFKKLTKNGYSISQNKNLDSYMQYMCDMLRGGDCKIEVHLDGVLLLAYGIVTVKECRRELEQVFSEAKQYYAKFDASEYDDEQVRRCVPAQYVWKMKLIMGILLQLRETRDEVLYQKVMKIICCGYKNVKKEIRKHTFMTGGIVKEINTKFKNIREDAMHMCSQILITFIIMEDMGVEMLWDFSIGVVLPFIEGYEKELKEGNYTDSINEKTEKSQNEWKEKFIESYGEEPSIRTLVVEKADDQNADAVRSVMALHGINPRKFYEYELTEQEQRLIAAQKEKWNSKIFWSVLIIAQLCKYIQDIEKRMVDEAPQSRQLMEWFEHEKHTVLEKENETLRNKINSMKNKLLIYEQTERDLQKQIKISEQKLKASQEHISNLKAFIYYLSEENPEENKENQKEKSEICWKEKQVLVLGGHPGWQNKLRAQYPKWQFLAAEQKSQISEAVKGKDYIICNTQMLSHSSYYKLLSCKDENQKVLYVRHTNIEKGLLELEQQLAD